METALRRLPSFRTREHFPQGLSWQDPQALRNAYQGLVDSDPQLDEDAVAWLGRWRELEAIVEQEYSIRYIATTCDTTDQNAAEALDFFDKNILPVALEFGQKVRKRFFGNSLLQRRLEAEAPRYFAKLAADFKIFHAENIPLSVESRGLSAEYDRLAGSLTVDWDGQNITLPRLAKEQEGADRKRREQAWRKEWERRAASKKEFDDNFDAQFARRVQMAKNSGFANFRDYAFVSKHRFDYSPEDCQLFHKAIKAAFVPLATDLGELRQQKLGLDSLRPWDMSVDLFGEALAPPFKDVQDLEAKVGRVFKDMDPELAAQYETISKHKLFDLANRPGKAPGGYQSFLAEAGLPFIFMNAVGSNRDLFTLLHESGHAFHSFQARHLDHFQVDAPMEFCEVASMSMEFMALPGLMKHFGENVANQGARANVLAVAPMLLRIAMIDSFQHWIYTSPEGADRAARSAKWLELHREYLPNLDITGVEELIAISWHKVLHIFQVPFYYVEYGVAELGALQFWRRYLENPSGALRSYKTALSLGGTMGPKDLFRRADLAWPMDMQVCRDLAAFLRLKLGDLVGLAKQS